MQDGRPTTPTPPQQARSRETQDALVTAAEHIFAEVGIAQATVAEICERAGVAIGTFYGRFPDKDALLQFWQERFLRRGRLAFDRAFSDAMWESRPAREIIRGWVQARVLHYRKNRALLRALLTYVRSRPATELRVFGEQLPAPTLERLSVLLSARRAEWGHDSPETALHMAVAITESTIQSFVLFNEHRNDLLAVSDDTLVEHLTDAMSAYLRLGVV